MATRAGTCIGRRRVEVGSITRQAALGAASTMRSGRRACLMRAPREGGERRERTVLTRHSPTSAPIRACRVGLRTGGLAGLTPAGVEPPAADTLHLPMAQRRGLTLRRSEEHTSELQSPVHLV